MYENEIEEYKKIIREMLKTTTHICNDYVKLKSEVQELKEQIGKMNGVNKEDCCRIIRMGISQKQY